MGMRRARFLACIAMAAIVLLAPPSTCGVAGHSRGLRPGRSAGAGGAGDPPPLFPVNATRAEMIERQFMEWVRYMGGLRHSTFQHALARAFPSYSLVVDKNPAFGDFTTIQAAIDSLPVINLVRVVIRVNAGTYTEKVSISAMRAFITLEGAGADSTIVQWGDTADSPTGPKGRPLGTFNSATFAVNAQYFLARNITFKVRNATGTRSVALRRSRRVACGLLNSTLSGIGRRGRTRRRCRSRGRRGSRRWRCGCRRTTRRSWGASSWARRTRCMTTRVATTTRSATSKGPWTSSSATRCRCTRYARSPPHRAEAPSPKQSMLVRSFQTIRFC
ncbi:hypothetical protein SORBI_3003G292100 [Sorghum bicolor]|uniref:pectinesterase n=1 Tax=Sorghum bicolor TaxID=4558 RepID=A0A1W0VZG9_SORBI|nr:hypothetical protein SORBI_3003G292100 [Sorghum bicolor]